MILVVHVSKYTMVCPKNVHVQDVAILVLSMITRLCFYVMILVVHVSKYTMVCPKSVHVQDVAILVLMPKTRQGFGNVMMSWLVTYHQLM
jgi:heterodisulfide reductase subunit C